MEDQQSVKNVYLDQVLQHQEKVDEELRRRAPLGISGSFAATGAPAPRPGQESAPRGGRAVDYRITGWWRWKTVIVPPNVYVVHTRRGRAEPLHIGQGISFRFNPYTDAFLIIPAAMQTILINANCICIERQGILVQAYVQWIIDDIGIAYRKLDFSDPEDPMRVVNVQLREQAEAAVKDKVATMSIDEVLSDKQPIIEELTHRLRTVAEGNRENGSAGLGLKIVTVQIKEAVVSSARLWQNLQSLFRAERAKLAHLAELESQQAIATRELENRIARETAQLQAEDDLARLRAEKEHARYDRERQERVRRQKLEQEEDRMSIAERNATAKAQKEAELELALQALGLEKRRIAREIEQVQARLVLQAAQSEQTRAQVNAEMEVQELRSQAAAVQTERDLALLRTRQEIQNDLSDSHLQAQLIARLPEIAQQLPPPQELRTTAISLDGQPGSLAPLAGFVAGVSQLVESWHRKTANSETSE